MNHNKNSEIGGPKSAFTKYIKRTDETIIVNRANRKSAFLRIKQLFSTTKCVDTSNCVILPSSDILRND